jgi:uncharacterized protein involved in propanediol utilization
VKLVSYPIVSYWTIKYVKKKKKNKKKNKKKKKKIKKKNDSDFYTIAKILSYIMGL